MGGEGWDGREGMAKKMVGERKGSEGIEGKERKGRGRDG